MSELQRSHTPMRSNYRVFTDADSGRTVYIARNGISSWYDLIEITTNVATSIAIGVTAYYLFSFFGWPEPVGFIPWLGFTALSVGYGNNGYYRWRIRWVYWSIFWLLIGVGFATGYFTWADVYTPYVHNPAPITQVYNPAPITQVYNPAPITQVSKGESDYGRTK